jgi:hypothetical protein
MKETREIAILYVPYFKSWTSWKIITKAGKNYTLLEATLIASFIIYYCSLQQHDGCANLGGGGVIPRTIGSRKDIG